MENPQAIESTLTKEDLYWLGGIIDGEGCIALSRRNRTETNFSYFPQVIVSNSDPFIIEEVDRILQEQKIGHWVMWRKPNATRKSKRMMGHISISGFKRCQRGLEILTPYIRSKKDQAILLAEFIERRLKIGHGKHNTYCEIDTEMYDKLRELKLKRAPETTRGGYRYYENPNDGMI